MNRAERRGMGPMRKLDYPKYPEVRMPPTPGLQDGDLIMLTQGGHTFQRPHGKEPQVFRVKVTE